VTVTPTAIPAPPVRPLSARLVDILVWGGVIGLLLISFGPVDMAHVPKLFSNSQNMRQFAQDFTHPDFTYWKLYVAKMWLTV